MAQRLAIEERKRKAQEAETEDLANKRDPGRPKKTLYAQAGSIKGFPSGTSRDWVRTGFWLRDGSWGPAPDQTGCTLPAALVAWCLNERKSASVAA